MPTPEAITSTSDADDIRQQALRDVGKIDREMRKVSLNMAERKLEYRDRRLDAFADAYVGGGTTIEEGVTEDGRRISRIGKHVCVQKESNGLVGGRDVFRDGVKTKVTSC